MTFQYYTASIRKKIIPHIHDQMEKMKYCQMEAE